MPQRSARLGACPPPRPSRAYRGPVTTAIFDWAGTVLDFGCLAPVRAFREVFEAAGVPISEAEARAPMGAAKREHIERILADAAVQARWRAARGAAPTDADVGALYAAFLSADERNLERYSDLIPGALDTVARLRAHGIRIGSTTGYPREVMNRLAPLAARLGYRPDHCCTVSDVARGRPFPDMCLANALALGAPDVRGCVVVDDSPSGLASGLAAGMWAVGVAASGNEVGLSLADWHALDADARAVRVGPARERLEQAGAHYVIDSIADLPGVIAAIGERLAAEAPA
ncbi:phosphonoacetaldehyde hydrolase [Burkholderia glumae]|uniref:Phosphonoacetaldehyde hydrolase n=1 Tax=Burkholderia glumae TaxID=337 RepID=A0AAP9XYZ2_BURGL|nr:phosphonoacetaldehyde hydrolase [Burkholderia glumae]ACR32280.1 Phosphonoacetaldehyde hydrolase [Burkholderia glumae BGR1]AJY64324.1 phosphonoacetaldehyde hydrolase [Burkholderia glumae LMG 2196 = ATCC 33617]MCM2484529.1 phosphonoacetaldehyde hydrolase [Burkholderia glumae]MCM2494909.1 phosphonoacetaldehyde hydrolase [Burkholderia glumae]MCM2510221.1 phosphonoacetaldehyde hydrolase [Burkholderia glumae]